MDFATGKGEPNNYYVYGAACADVEVDCLTGVHRVSEWIRRHMVGKA